MNRKAEIPLPPHPPRVCFSIRASYFHIVYLYIDALCGYHSVLVCLFWFFPFHFCRCCSGRLLSLLNVLDTHMPAITHHDHPLVLEHRGMPDYCYYVPLDLNINFFHAFDHHTKKRHLIHRQQ